MKICVIGADGFVGRNLCRVLAGDVVPVDVNSADPAAVRGATVCVNLAAKIFATAASPEELLSTYLESSVAPIHQYLPYLEPTLQQWIQLSSISVYQPSADGRPITEDQSLLPANAYGVGKLAAERHLRTLRGVTLQVLRMPDIYGTERRHPDDNRVLPMVERAFLADAQPLAVFGTGDERRDMLHVTDACRAIVACIETPRAGVWNVGSGGGISINEMIRIIAPFAVHRPLIQRFPERTSVNQLLDSRKFATDFGFAPRVDFASGIADEFIAVARTSV